MINGKYTESEVKRHLAEWVMALEGGKYAQGKGALRPSDDTFCCLGVGCEISKVGKWNFSSYILYRVGENYNLEQPDHSESGFPISVAKYFGFEPHDSAGCEVVLKLSDEERGALSVNGVTDLADLNDDGVSFKEIARLIRSYAGFGAEEDLTKYVAD